MTRKVSSPLILLKKSTIVASTSSLIFLGSGAAIAQENPEMEEVLVFGTQGLLDTSTASRLNLSVLETPATVDVIDGDAIRARVDISVLEAVTRSAGFTSESNPGNGHFSIAARGFRGQGSVTKLYDGTNYFTAAGTITFPFDTWGVKQIDVLKGPASVLYGEGGIGGAINIIPKVPEYDANGSVRVIVGENSTGFVGFDYTDGLSDSVAYRVNYSNSQSDNWVNNGESDAEMLSLSLRWDVSEDLALSARYDRGEQNPMQYFGVPIENGDFIKSLVKDNFNVGDAKISYEDESIRLKADWTLSDTASWQTEVYRLNTDRYWSNSEFYSYDSTSGLVERWDPLVIGHDMEHDGLRSNLNFALANSAVNASVGFEMNDISFTRPTNFGPANPDPIDWGNDSDTVDANNFQPGLLSDLTDAPVLLDNMSDVKQKALFGELQYHLSDSVVLVGALRYDDFSTDYVRLGQAAINQDADATTGRVGLVYNLSENSAIYSQYGTGASHPSNSVVTASASNRESDLIESEQWEIGFKNQVGNSRLQWNIAFFDIVKNNLTEDDPDSADPNDFIVIPEQTSHGIEIGWNYVFDAGVQLYGNLSVLNAETNSGETPTYIPEKTANVGLAWDFSENIRVIADARHVGERFHSDRPIPSYTVVDASVKWDLGNRFGLTLKADNLFDELYASAAYYSSTWLVGKTRTLSIVADYNF